MQSIYYKNSATQTTNQNLIKEILKYSFKNNTFAKYFEGKKLVILFGNKPNDDGRYFNIDIDSLILDKEVDFNFSENLKEENRYNKKNYRGVYDDKISDYKVMVNEHNLMDVILTLMENHKNSFVQLEMEADFIQKFWFFQESVQSSSDIDHHLSLLLSKEQMEKYKSQLNSNYPQSALFPYVVNFLGGISRNYYNKETKGESFIYSCLTSQNPNVKSYGFSYLVKNEIVTESYGFTNKLMTNLMLDRYGKEDMLKKYPYLILWDSSEHPKSLYPMLKEVFTEKALSQKEQDKLMKKMFNVLPIPINGYGDLEIGIKSFFLTLKEYDEEFFYKKFASYFETKSTVERKKINLILFEDLMSDEDIAKNKELFKDIFPIFYQENISFKSFIEIKPKEIKYAEFKIKDIMDLFPLNASNEQIMFLYVTFVTKIMNNYKIEVFVKSVDEVIVEKKKEREVTSLIQFYFSGVDLSILSNEFLQKMLRLIHEQLQNDIPDRKNMESIAREMYLKLNLSDDEEKVERKKGKI